MYFIKAAAFSQLGGIHMAMKRKNLPEVVPELFEHEEFGQFRYIKRGEELWFVANDVCRALDIQNPRDVVAKQLDDDEKDVDTIYTLGGPQKVNIVSEPGLYHLIFISRKPEAKKFRRWVFHEVSIRRYGYYVAPNQRVITIEGDKNFKEFKARYPEGAVEVKAEHDYIPDNSDTLITIYKVVILSNN